MDIVIAKVESIERCLSRIREEYAGNPANLENFTKQDSVVLNLQRACETSLDLANYVIAKFGFESPRNSRESFEILAARGFISEPTCATMKKIIGFRNLAVHNYKKLDMGYIKSIIENQLDDFKTYCHEVVESFKRSIK